MVFLEIESEATLTLVCTETATRTVGGKEIRDSQLYYAVHIACRWDEKQRKPLIFNSHMFVALIFILVLCT